MIEDYGTLSEEELLEEIVQELEEDIEIDASNLEYHFEGGKLMIHGTLTNQEDLEYLIGILENHIDPSDYKLEIELLEGEPSPALAEENFEEKEEETEEEGFVEESLDKIEDDEMDFVDEEGFDDEKW